MKNKHLAVMFFILILFCGLGCGALPVNRPNKIQIIASITPLAQLVEKVGKSKVDVLTIVPADVDPYAAKSRPWYFNNAKQAKIYVHCGLGFEFESIWKKILLKTNGGIIDCDTSKGIYLLPDDPYFWVSIRNSISMINRIKESLISLDPKNKYFYAFNAGEYIKDLQANNLLIYKLLRRNKNKIFLVYRPNLGYFARDYSLRQISIENNDIERIIPIAKNNRINVIFTSPQHDQRIAQEAAKRINGIIINVDILSKDYIKYLLAVTKLMSESR